MTNTRTRSNRYPGTCTDCGGHVDAEAGLLAGSPGAWTVKHGQCPENAAPAPAPEPVVDPPEGVHRGEDGTVYRVKMARTSRKPYAQIVRPGGTTEYVGRSPFRSLSDATLLTYDEAVEISAQFGFCIRCGRALSADLSVALGIGPVCGKHLHDQERRRRAATVAEPPNPYVNMNAVPVSPGEQMIRNAVPDPDVTPDGLHGGPVGDRTDYGLDPVYDPDETEMVAPSPARHVDAAIDVLDAAFPEYAS